MTFWKRWLPKVERSTIDQPKLPSIGEIEETFCSLVEATNAVTKAAVDTTKALTRRLELTERRFTMLADSVDDVILVKTVDRKWVSVNKFACEVFCLDRDKCIGKTNAELGEVYPHLKQIIECLDRAEKAAWKNKTTENMKLQIEEHNHSIMLDIMVTPIESYDKTVHELIIVGHNNTHYYENLKRCASDSNIFDRLSYPIMIVDAVDNRVYFTNTEYQKEFRTEYRKTIRKPYFSILPHELSEKLMVCFEEKKESTDIEWNGFEIRVKTIMDEETHNPLYFLLTFHKKENRSHG